MATLEKTLTVRLTPEERMAVEEYAKENNMTIAQLARASLLEKIGMPTISKCIRHG